MSDLEIAAREFAAELMAKFPAVPVDQLLVLAFMQGSILGMDRAQAAWTAGDAIGRAKRNAA